MGIAHLHSASLEIVHERIDVGAAHIGIALSVPRRVEQAALGSQRIVAASGDALPHHRRMPARAPTGAVMTVRCRRASVNRRSGAVNRHERDVRMTCSSRSRAVARRVLSSSRACAADKALASACAFTSSFAEARVFLGDALLAPPADSERLRRDADPASGYERPSHRSRP